MDGVRVRVIEGILVISELKKLFELKAGGQMVKKRQRLFGPIRWVPRLRSAGVSRCFPPDLGGSRGLARRA